MAINNNSFSANTNIEFGSNQIEGVWFNAQSMIIPSMSFSPPKISGRSGAQINLAPDVVTYTDLVIDIILDKEWKVYDDIYAYFMDSMNVEQGTFKPKKMDIWTDIKDGKGNSIKKFWFFNCRITDISEINVSLLDAGDELNVMTLSFTFDYMDYDNSFYKEKFK